MKIKSRVWHWLAVACGGAGLVLGMGAEGTAQTGGTLNGNAFTTAVVLILTGLLFMKLGFLAQEREERETKGLATAAARSPATTPATTSTLPCRSAAAAAA